MLNFKQFLQEKSVDTEPKYQTIVVDKAIRLLNAHCKNALWMLHENRPIYRSDRKLTQVLSDTGVVSLDTRLSTRKSQNTSNFYTLILDNTPSRKDFPKRSKSLIASTRRSRAEDFSDEIVHAIIPYDDTKIGFVNLDDMWDTRIDIFGVRRQINTINKFFEEMVDENMIDHTWESFIKFDKDVDTIPSLSRKFNKIWNYGEEGTDKYPHNNFLESIDKAYSPDETGHTWVTASTMPHHSSSEVWVEGDCIIMTESLWKQIRAAYHELSQ